MFFFNLVKKTRHMILISSCSWFQIGMYKDNVCFLVLFFSNCGYACWQCIGNFFKNPLFQSPTPRPLLGVRTPTMEPSKQPFLSISRGVVLYPVYTTPEVWVASIGVGTDNFKCEGNAWQEGTTQKVLSATDNVDQDSEEKFMIFSHEYLRCTVIKQH